ncbi:IncA protein [Chlamydia serpentis]|uniref:IncA protein n=1 Tax=Chlamydia serpentis TaxID=1967782 RepID=A0A2R8FA83_9CHLA|nr:hypothetical protein [Chlamydia serpentis]SPN73325.1 IncA protein [Chlamydia serpentis]
MTENNIKNVSTAPSKVLTQPVDKESLTPRYIKLTVLVIALLLLLGGIALIALSVTTLPLIPALIPGIILVVISSIFLVSKLYVTCKSLEIAVVKGDREIDKWVQNQRNIDLRKAEEDPEHFGENVGDGRVGHTAGGRFELMVSQCESRVLEKLYRENKDLILFKGWVPKTIDGIDRESESHIRNVISCYKLIKACKSKLPEIIKEAQSRIQILPPKKASQKELLCFCIQWSGYRFGPLSAIRTGSRVVMNAYLELRKNNPPELFFTPGHPCYYARLAFNNCVELCRNLIDIQQLQQAYDSQDYSANNNHNIKPILALVKTTDDGAGFLSQHQGLKLDGRSGCDLFWA